MATRRNLFVFMLLFSFLLQFGCTESQVAKEPTETVQKAKIADEAPELVSEGAPEIRFEKTIYDFGNIWISESAQCKFKFKNTGGSDLEIGKINATCGCTVPRLDKKVYKPGEEGSLSIKYSGQSRPGRITKSINVFSNDKNNSVVKLTIKAKIVHMVEFEPKEIKLLLNKDNAGLSEIRLKSMDGTAFSITSFTSTGDKSIAAEFEPNVLASEFVLRPKVNLDKVNAKNSGRVEIKLTHPQCRSILIPYNLVTQFRAIPKSFNIFEADPKIPITIDIKIINNYGEDFEIESTSSLHGYIKVLSTEKVKNGYKYKIETTPPSDKGGNHFSDTFYVQIKGESKLSVRCNGYFDKGVKSQTKRKKTDMASGQFTAQPQTIKINNAESGKPVTREIWVSSKKNEAFDIESTYSQNGTIKLLSQQLEGNRYKLKLEITPPAKGKNLRIFSDVFYVNIKSGEDKKAAQKLSVFCRGAYLPSTEKN